MNIQSIRDHLKNFDFQSLFVDGLGVYVSGFGHTPFRRVKIKARNRSHKAYWGKSDGFAKKLI